MYMRSLSAHLVHVLFVRQLNSFQVVLATDGHLSFVMLNYANLTWTTGTLSGSNEQTGLGGIPAVVSTVLP